MPAQIDDDAMLVLHDDAMRQLIEREGWPFTEPEVVFTPLKAVPHT
jgi:urease accessory protein